MNSKEAQIINILDRTKGIINKCVNDDTNKNECTFDNNKIPTKKHTANLYSTIILAYILSQKL